MKEYEKSMKQDHFVFLCNLGSVKTSTTLGQQSASIGCLSSCSCLQRGIFGILEETSN